jgi:hypothetical protein
VHSRYFSANYAIVIALLAVYSLLTNILLLFAGAFLIGGFIAINRFGEQRHWTVTLNATAHLHPTDAHALANEPFEFQGRTITPQNLYIALFVIGQSSRVDMCPHVNTQVE